MGEHFDGSEILYNGWMKYGTLGWMEHLDYVGDGTWRVSYESFNEECEDEQYVLDIGELIKYTIERDLWLAGDSDELVDLEIELSDTEREFFYHNHPEGMIGPHLNNLLTILKQQGFGDELELAKVAAGIYWIQPEDVIDARKIGLKIKGLSRKAVWLHIYRKVYSVQSFYGDGLINPPSENGYTSLFLYQDQSAYSFDYKPRNHTA